MKKWFLVFMLAGLWSAAFAQIGQPVESLEASMQSYQPLKTVLGYFTGEGFKFELSEKAGALFSVSAEGPLNATNIPIAADLIGYASGFDTGISDPVKDFLSNRVGELVGQGEVPLAVEQYYLYVEVTNDSEPYKVKMRLELVNVDTSLFPVATHSLGPADAKHVIREFSDFQCPFCSQFSQNALPKIKQDLLSRGDVRFEFHHFPLTSIHANAFPAAEASECVAIANNPEAFWTFHDALFERQQAWSNLSDAAPYFLRLAQDEGLSTDGLEGCLSERQTQDTVQIAYDAAVQLGIRGTPTVYVDGYKVGDFNAIESYLNLLDISEKFAE